MSNDLVKRAETWLHRDAERRPSGLEGEMHATLGELLLLQERLSGVRARLALRPSTEDGAALLVAELGAARAKLASRLGLLLVEWRLGGGEVDFRPAPNDEAVPSSDAVGVGETHEGDALHVADEQRIGTEMGAASVWPVPVLRETIPAPRGDHDPALPVASDEAIAAWRRQVEKTGLGRSSQRSLRPTAVAEHWRALLRSLLDESGPPNDVRDIAGVVDEVDALDEATSDAAVAQWPTLPREAQRALLGALVARARSIKEVGALSPGLRERLQDVLRRFPAYAGEHQPGHVNGLRVDHSPRRASWRDDAIALWAQLEALADDEPEPLSEYTRTSVVPPRSKKVREPVDDEEARDPVGPDWPLWHLVRGRHGVIVGGEPRETSRARIERVFGFESLEWIAGDNDRRHEALIGRVASGNVDLVMVVQNLVTHKASAKIIDACKAAGVDWAVISGYGVRAITQGLERYVARG